MERLITYAEAAKRLRVTRAMLKAIVARGDLGIVDLGHRTKRVRESDLTAYIEAKSRRGPCSN